MSFDFVVVTNVILEELEAQRSIAASMERLIDCCESMRPHYDWRNLRDLPFDRISSLEHWLGRAFRDEPPGDEINGLWFGLFNPVVAGQPVADLYVCGSSRFDANDPEGDWACGPEWWPEFRYASSEVLADIYRIAYQEDGLGNDAEYPLCTGYAALAVQSLLTPHPEVLEPLRGAGVAVGWDSGDRMLLGKIGPDGLVAMDS